MSKEIQKQITELFEINQLLGSGAYGHVWKVQEKSTKKTYALKKVFDAFQNEVDAQRTYRQITILYQLDHPGIIKLRGVIKADNDKDLYLVFQHMETDLHSLVGEDILEMPHLLHIIYQIFKALKYLHSAQLVHRDLKPSNVLINSDCQIKLCDFGLVRSLTRQENAQLVLSEDVATRWYRSPQMLLGSHEYSWPTDVWSVGCILAELIIGQPIMMGGSNIQQLQKILELTGTPKKEDILSLKSSISQSLICQFKTMKKPFRHYFKGCKFESSHELINLIKCMLQFNPQKRITVDGVLEHQLFSQIRNKREETLCKKMVIPELDDNVRLKVDQYRGFIYKDILRRYPEYNVKVQDSKERDGDDEGQEIKRVGSIPRINRAYHSMMKSNLSSISSLPRAKLANSLMKPIRSKNHYKTTIQTRQPKPMQHQSLHCNTIHNSNFYKSSLQKQKIQQKQNIASVYSRKNPFISSIQNKIHNKSSNKQSTDVSTVVEKSPFRKYKRLKEKEDNDSKKMDIIEDLVRENNLHTLMSKSGSKQHFINVISPKNVLSSSKQSFHNPSKMHFYDPTSIYKASPPKQIVKKEKNLYKVHEISNQSKISKKTFTRFRKENMNSLVSENKISNHLSKLTSTEIN